MYDNNRKNFSNYPADLYATKDSVRVARQSAADGITKASLNQTAI